MTRYELIKMDELIDQIKGCGHGLTSDIARDQMECALAHLRQAWRAENFGETETAEQTSETMREVIRLNHELGATPVSGGVS